MTELKIVGGKFELGRLLFTPGALDLLAEGHNLLGLIGRHARGDWGDLADEDKAENDFSVDRHLRIMSSYKLEGGIKVWVITEADRSVTTALLPSEY